MAGETGEKGFLESMELSLENVCADGFEFLEKSRAAYESMKDLKKDIEGYEKKKKLLELQIEKLRTAFVEYVHSIEAIENSEIYKRAVPVKKLNHSRVLKYSHLFMPPSISSTSESIHSSINKIIKKASEEYKHAKNRYDGLLSFIRTESITEGSLELERQFQLYEKKVNFTQHKMNFSIQMNKLSLTLLKEIFNEIESIEKVSVEHARHCLSIQRMKEYQYNSVDNAISPMITKEVTTLAQLAPDELERHKRKITNEYRPVNEERMVRPVETLIKRKLIPDKEGFLFQRKSKSTEVASFFARFEIGDNLFRGVFQISSDVLVICDMVFGWNYSIQKNEIVFFRPAESLIILKTETVWLKIFCTYRDVLDLCQWYNNSKYESVHPVLIGSTEESPSTLLQNKFIPEAEDEIKSLSLHGYTLISNTTWENKVKKRSFMKHIKYKDIRIFSVLYTETYTADEGTEYPTILLFSTIKVLKFIPEAQVISRICFKRTVEMGDHTDIYCYVEKGTFCWPVCWVIKWIMLDIIKVLHRSSAYNNDQVRMNSINMNRVLYTSIIIAGISIILGVSLTFKVFSLFTAV
ncbi:hypothetical protein NEPAR06_1804 [Nematocida parisii]|uniref:Uncharacterized protein n=1 Tax=Nematocida parisii (strain ERTm3) TaxID=935791 RepID=I3EJX6_NEMP3|nr:uncharacterized protein NEPG_00947 [Nematocida parisii ERTm1]EIJ89523.1 hypothetical protein NEQG_00293 [Nematocida parisii ERTm3]KAI5145538.1 hypothetical protein NEPAR07_1757 [Nematocida parisii]EIJ94280.1 hypothetical protein NEPG_00947 [Nematocida parisii ERTm1]KAI5155411.1 hypothetical protein NEPAR06_1804 [Nematocida parisii]KAI5158097.1 hypothetical protein NEPAR05_1864 [Nematocida parisii]|eukprot:XP_013058776.1 hypothetical protein NEPG_00947 [Nematocida parisii ERTm1]